MELKAFSARLVGMAPWICAFFLAFLPAWASAGTFQLSASVDRTQLELGDSLQFTLSLTVDGSLTFQPNVVTPTFDGFDAQGPSQSYSSSWINGASTLVYTWTWELEAKKAGRMILGPYRASAKDALNGNIDRSTDPIVIMVQRPKGLNYPLPSQAASGSQSGQEPEPDAGSLRGIKPDRGIPWVLMAEAFGGLLLLLIILALIGQHNPPQVVEEPLPADPAQAAIARLDRAQRDYLSGADGRLYAIKVGEALRLYLRQRLDLRAGLTLGEAIRTLRLQAPQVQPQRVGVLRQRLELLLYGGSEFRLEDREQLDLDARGLIRGLETARKLTPAQQALSKTLTRMAELWKEGQAKSAWMGMRSATVEHVRKAQGLGPAPLPQAALARALRSFDAPELIRSLDSLASEAPPRGYYAETLADRLLRLAQALDSLGPDRLNNGAEASEKNREPGDDSGPDDEGEA
jgi:hypothetical protein